MKLIKRAEKIFGVKVTDLTPFEQKRLSVLDKDILVFSVNTNGKTNILLREKGCDPFLCKFSLKELYKKKAYTKRWLAENRESGCFVGVSNYYQRILKEITFRK